MKILGVHVDSNLDFKEHISSVGNMVTKNVALLRRIKCYPPMSARRISTFHSFKLFLTIVQLFGGLGVI